MSRDPYVEILAAGPRVDVTVFGAGHGCPTASLTPAEAKRHARELVDAAEEVEGCIEEGARNEPGLSIKLLSKADGRCENGQNRPTIAVDAGSEAAAIRKATREQKKAIGSERWPVVSFTLIPELVNVIEHATPAQRKALRRLRAGGDLGCNAAMTERLTAKGWIRPGEAGRDRSRWVLTSTGRREADR